MRLAGFPVFGNTKVIAEVMPGVLVGMVREQEASKKVRENKYSPRQMSAGPSVAASGGGYKAAERMAT